MSIKSIVNKSILCGTAVIFSATLFAGNGDRVGSAGATQLLINPWARGIGMADAGVASDIGMSATFTNIAGLAFTPKTEIMFDRTNWLGGAGINVNSAGLAQRVSETTVFSVGITALSFGDIDITTVNQPEGGIGQFTPRMNTFNLGLAHEFSSSIYAGINLKVATESIANIKGNGIGLDVGIRYVTGEQDNIKFGIALKNIGPTMSYSGDGLATLVTYPETGLQASLEQRSESFELPSLLSIGASYDFNFTESDKLTISGAFTANSFSYDQIRIGADFGKEIEQAAFHVKAGYVYERGIFSSEYVADGRATALSGLTAGVSVDAILGESRNNIGIQYAFRAVNVFNGIHTIGLTLSLN
ncbi:MAG: PorV/PorQ family protein [Crocinitomicaceae bacterium]